MLGSITKALADIFSPLVLKFVLKVGFGSILFWVVALGAGWSYFEEFVAHYISMLPYVGKLTWFQEGGAFVSALILGYTLVIITISILTSLFSEPVLIELAKKHYPNISPIKGGKVERSLYYTIKANIVFVILLLLLFPLLFVPILGQIVMLWLWSIQLKEPTIYDVGTLFIADEKRLLKESKGGARIIAIISALFNYIPVLNIFAPLYAQIMFLHYILSKETK